MFTRREVFTESFLPQEIHGRETELGRLQRMLWPAVRGEAAEYCFELGPSGVGKTTTARWALQDLRDNYAIGWTRVECVGSSRWQLLSEICGKHPRVPHHNGMGCTDMTEELQEWTTRPFIVILDEFDGLEHPELLADLASVDLCSLICIGHDEESALQTVPKEVEKLRDCERVEFEPYTVGDLVEILEARVKTGLKPGVVDDDQVQRIAERASGSARYGVQSLRSAVELSEKRGDTEVIEEDVADCFDHAKTRIREQLLASLSRQHHIVYQIIRDAGAEGITSGELLEAYQERSDNPRSRQQVGNYRQKLARYDLIATEGTGRWARHHVVDDTLAAPLRREKTA